MSKTIYVLLTRSGTWVSRVIHLLTDDTYTHASIAFDASLQPLYSFSRKFVNLPLPAGLRTEPLTRGFYKKYARIPCALYALTVEDHVYEAVQREVFHMMEDAPHYRFNLIGLFLCKLGIPFHREHHFFCSEFVGEVLHRGKALTLPKVPSLMRPNDYAMLPELQCRYQGKLETIIRNYSLKGNCA